MSKLLVLLALLCTSLAQAQLDYDTSPSLIKTAHERSHYWLHRMTWEVGTNDDASIEQFLEEANRRDPVVVHAHGCLGVHGSDDTLKSHYMYNKINVVQLDFLRRPGVVASCDRARNEGHVEVMNPRRIEARRMEMEHQIQWLRAQGFTNVHVSGHSEGGRVAQGLRADVRSVMVHGMDCKPVMRHFWADRNPENRIFVFLSRRDNWLGWPKHQIVGCSSWFSNQITQYWTEIETHEVLPEASWRDLVVDIIHGRLSKQ